MSYEVVEVVEMEMEEEDNLVEGEVEEEGNLVEVVELEVEEEEEGDIPVEVFVCMGGWRRQLLAVRQAVPVVRQPSSPGGW